MSFAINVYLVASPSGCCSRSSLARQERQRNRSAFPFSLRARLVITQPSVGLMGLSLCFLNVFCSLCRFYDPGNRLAVVVLVYIQMIRTLIFAKRVELSLRPLNQPYSWGEVLWMRRQFWKASKFQVFFWLKTQSASEVGSGAAVFRVPRIDFPAKDYYIMYGRRRNKVP